MTEVPSKPVIKLAFERKFLKDKAGKKYYIPEIFYDESYKEVSEKLKERKYQINGIQKLVIFQCKI